MSKKRRNKPVATGIISDCDVCGGFMFNAKRYMHMNDACSFTADQVMFPYEAKNIFDRIVHGLHYLNIETHTISRWIWTSWTGYLSTDFCKVRATPFL